MIKQVNYDGQFMTVQNDDGERSRKNNVLKYSYVYPLFLWIKMGLKTYLSDLWNAIEMVSYCAFLIAFYCKIQMYFNLAQSIEADYNQLLLHQCLLRTRNMSSQILQFAPDSGPIHDRLICPE